MFLSFMLELDDTICHFIPFAGMERERHVIRVVAILHLWLWLLNFPQRCSGRITWAVADLHEDNPNMCYWESDGAVYAIGSIWYPEKGYACLKATCLYRRSSDDSQKELMVRFESCNPVNVSCETSENLALEYPDCCPQPICDDDSLWEMNKTTKIQGPKYNATEEVGKAEVGSNEVQEGTIFEDSSIIIPRKRGSDIEWMKAMETMPLKKESDRRVSHVIKKSGVKDYMKTEEEDESGQE